MGASSILAEQVTADQTDMSSTPAHVDPVPVPDTVAVNTSQPGRGVGGETSEPEPAGQHKRKAAGDAGQADGDGGQTAADQKRPRAVGIGIGPPHLHQPP